MGSASDLPAGAPGPRRSRAETASRLVAGLSGLLLTGLLCAVVVRNGRPFPLDSGWHRWVLDHRSAELSDVAVAVTNTGAGACAYVLAAVAGAVAVGRRGRWWLGAGVGFAALLTGQLLRTSLATIVGRARPPVADWVTHPSGFAFPSGHTTTSALVAAGLAAVLYRRARHPAVRVAAVAIPGLWAFAVGATRILLGVHWPTDVLAGWLLAGVLAGVFLPPLAALLGWIGRDRNNPYNGA
ncbi:phosphatase PAP2 family protein [Parafrankia sp. EUN1f]|uniref:phosphatase PAP2 family protein n=1 Tax=Parafrankia sp. EUN1f TaxID=102897 RepID=UPI0001C4515D|nr:phosphatase PAP2 family protein [Parafrankia sp. EUN1f]EFC84418.1 phosphoesterase PA-phosphatase related protein [Parafrankia sp. EUN1f]